MASSTPPPHCTLTTTKPYQNNHLHHLKNTTTTNPLWISKKVSLNRPRNATTTNPAATALPCSKTHLSADFSGRRSTRFVSKMHFGRPKFSSSSRHTSAAEEALQRALGCKSGVETVLVGFESRLSGSDDYIFLLRELGNRGELEMAMGCFEFAIGREKRRGEMGKLASSMISILGRLGKVEFAEKVFNNAIDFCK